MITVKLMGGLGNQMFQYALGRRLSEIHNTKLRLDLTFLLDRRPQKDFVYRNYDLGIFNILEDFTFPYIATHFIGNIKSNPLINTLSRFNTHKKTIISEEYFHYNEKIPASGDNIYLVGYWQSPKYFYDIEDIIRKEFTFKKSISKIAFQLSQKILKVNAVCINARRTDFINLKNTNEAHGVMNKNYYYEAIKIITDKIKCPHFFVFSDDINWCIENIKLKYPTTVVNHEYAGPKFKDYLYLMTLCKHFIIPNSTFGWWAAWLNTNQNKMVIAPQNWFKDATLNAQTKDLMPRSWLRI